MRYTYNENSLLNEDATSFYLLGAFITDGCIYYKRNILNNFSICSADEQWMNDIRNLISPLKPIRFSKGCYEFRGTSLNICNWLNLNQCTPKKSLTVQMPNIPDEYFFDFLRGVIDGDGSINYNGKNNRYFINICSASKLFIDEIIVKLNQFGINTFLYERKEKSDTIRGKKFTRTTSTYQITISSRYAYKICKLIYKNNTICLERKHQKALQIIKHFEDKGLNLDNFDTFDFNRGENNASSKLSNQDVINIRKSWEGFSNDKSIKRRNKSAFFETIVKPKYGICLSSSNYIVGNYSWSEI